MFKSLLSFEFLNLYMYVYVNEIWYTVQESRKIFATAC